MSEIGTDPRPSVVLPREMVPLPLAIGLGSIMAVGLLAYLLSNRQSVTEDSAMQQGVAQKAPPALVVPLVPPQRVSEPLYATMIPQRSFPAERRTGGWSRPTPTYYPPARENSEPAPVLDDGSESRRLGAGATGMPIAIDLSRGRSGSPERPSDSEVIDDGSRPQRDTDAVTATQIRNRVSTIPQGAVIAAVLETPLDSDRPGLARAIISQDVRGFDGTRILIPRGSRLIGEFKAEVTPGLRRIPVIWTRLIRPDGVAIRIASPGADPLGGAGIGGRVNTHFAQSLLGAVLQSALTVGVNVLSSSSSNSGNPIYVGLPGQAQQVGEQLVPKTDRPPTIKVRAGAEISVMVARDLDFSGTPLVR